MELFDAFEPFLGAKTWDSSGNVPQFVVYNKFKFKCNWGKWENASYLVKIEALKLFKSIREGEREREKERVREVIRLIIRMYSNANEYKCTDTLFYFTAIYPKLLYLNFYFFGHFFCKKRPLLVKLYVYKYAAKCIYRLNIFVQFNWVFFFSFF